MFDPTIKINDFNLQLDLSLKNEEIKTPPASPKINDLSFKQISDSVKTKKRCSIKQLHRTPYKGIDPEKLIKSINQKRRDHISHARQEKKLTALQDFLNKDTSLKNLEVLNSRYDEMKTEIIRKFPSEKSTSLLQQVDALFQKANEQVIKIDETPNISYASIEEDFVLSCKKLMY